MVHVFPSALGLLLLALRLLLLATCVLFCGTPGTIARAAPPNVLMIVVDDLNDWVEPLGGHPDVRTPAMSQLAARGMTFANAHCQSPLCNSSRCSALFSIRPSTSGIYGLAPWIRQVDGYREMPSLPQAFEAAGYQTYSGGKVFHNAIGRNRGMDLPPEFQNWGPGQGPGLTPPKKLVPPTPAGNNPWVDWGVFDHEITDKNDYKVATWAVESLRNMPADKPFFMAAGFFLPHVPCHATPKYWAMYPHPTLPAMQVDDRADCSPFSWYLHWNLPEPRLSWLQHHDEHENLVRAYLACISFTDSQIARVLTALDESGHRDDTIVVLWSDHGWHLGEKQMTGKTTLWERSTRVPLIFAGTGVAQDVCGHPVELLDMYPTLCEMTGLTVPEHVEGHSLVRQLNDPTIKVTRPAVTDHNPGNQSLRDERYRLIHYADGSEELYDLRDDPGEFDNLIGDASMVEVAASLRDHYDNDMAPLAEGSRQRVLERRDDGWYWEGKRIDPDHPPMDIGPTPTAALPR